MEGWMKTAVSVGCIVIFLAILLWRILPLIFFKKRATQVDGQIINWMSGMKKQTRIFRPVISYNVNGVELVKTVDDICEGKPLFPNGTKVIVFVNPKNPNDIKVEYPKVD